MAPKSKKHIEISIQPKGQAANNHKNAKTTKVSTQPTITSPSTSFKLNTSWTPALIEKLKSYATILVTGPTGCGKSTQVPVAIRFAFPDARTLLVQPRRLATERLAHYIASLLGTTVGDGVGFFMGRCNISDNRTQLLIATAGAAFNRILSRPDEFDFIILDEIHEESPQIEQLKAVCKIAQQKYNFKLILMSATKDPLVLQAIFPNFYHFTIETIGIDKQQTNFQIKEFYGGMLEGDKGNRKSNSALKLNVILRDIRSPAVLNHKPYLKAAAVVLLKILVKWKQGDIIVFLPGIAAITDFIYTLDGIATPWTEVRRLDKPKYNILVVHSMCSEEYKLDSLTAMSKSQTVPNVLLATNLCETSLTLPTLCYVVDTGLTRQFTLKDGRKKLVTTLTSIESMIQRRGRVGRVCPGEYHSVIHVDAFSHLSPCYAKETEIDSLPYLILLSFLGNNQGEESSASIFSSLISELLLTSKRFTNMDIFYTLRSLLASSLAIQYDTIISTKKDHPIQQTHNYFVQYYRCSADDSMEAEDQKSNYEDDKQSSESEEQSTSTSVNTLGKATQNASVDDAKEASLLSPETIAMIKDSKHYGISERAVLPLLMKYSLDKSIIYYWHFMLGLPYTGMAIFSFNAINYSIFISDLEMKISRDKLKDSVTNTALLLLTAILNPDVFMDFYDKGGFYLRIAVLDIYARKYSQDYIEHTTAVTILRRYGTVHLIEGYSDGAAAAIILALWRKRFPVPTEHPTDEEAHWCLVRCLSPYSLRQLELEIISCRSKLAKAGLLSEPPSHEQLLMETVYPLTNTELVSELQSYGYCYYDNQDDEAYDGHPKRCMECWEKYAKDKHCTNSTLSVILQEAEHYKDAYFKLCAFADIMIAMDKPGSEVAAYFDMNHQDSLKSIAKDINSVLEGSLTRSLQLKDFVNGQKIDDPNRFKLTCYSELLVESYSTPLKVISVNLANINNILRRPWEPVYNYCPYTPSVSLDLVASKHNTNFQSLLFDRIESLIYYMPLLSGSLIAGTPSIKCQTRIVNGAYLHNGPLVTLLIHILVNDCVDCMFYQFKENPNTFIFELCRFDQHFYRVRLDTIEKQNTLCSILVAISIILERYGTALNIFSETGNRKPSAGQHRYITDHNLVEQLSAIFGRDIQLTKAAKDYIERVRGDEKTSPILCFSRTVLEFIQTPLNNDTPYLPGMLGLIELIDLNEYELRGTIRTFEYQKGTNSVINA